MPGAVDLPGLTMPTGITTAVTVEEAIALARLAAGKNVLELGAYHGYSTVVLASVATHVTSVDWHMGDDHAGLGDSWSLFCENLETWVVADKVTAIRARFEEELPRMAERGLQFDGCFLDAMHDEASVTRDVALALPLVRPGGFFAFHDYGRSELTGNAGFAVTPVADRLGITGQAGFLGWVILPEV